MLAISLVLAALVALAGLGVVVVYNGLVRRRTEAQGAWAQIDVQLKRRYDLIDNLVNTVKGYAAHERDTLERVIAARNRAVAANGVADQANAENALSAGLRGVMAVIEQYPDLKANQSFLSLQEEITATENRISFSRQYYNDTVQIYNASLQSFPNNLLADAMGFAPREFFQIESGDQREAPRVKV